MFVAAHHENDVCIIDAERYAAAGVDLVCTKDAAGSLVWTDKATADKRAADAKAAQDAEAARLAEQQRQAEAARQQQAQQPAPAPVAPAPAAPAPPAPPAPVPGSVTAGAFCSSSQAGAVGHTSTGLTVYCTKDAGGSRYRWRQ
ncbi:hypothetical protein SCMU_10630 [Sinomonas cyclohexanicum]|uniref:Uncharacterized protein n=1 Tax=Sinomonas cyclohexanicum TaxID=322009 RepID=A0ABN6FEW6_SINCY|nr:hypothetical protein [Corynebacterium cyclohexanicum]BCT75221.1 hypothetical protein SCMU_10630 [Corynebacterium cyclohexanicum]